MTCDDSENEPQRKKTQDPDSNRERRRLKAQFPIVPVPFLRSVTSATKTDCGAVVWGRMREHGGSGRGSTGWTHEMVSESTGGDQEPAWEPD